MTYFIKILLISFLCFSSIKTITAQSTKIYNDPDANFKLAKEWFMKEQYSKAKPLFAEIKDIENTYAAPATYYYSHIAYLEKKYEIALEGFKKFSKNSTEEKKVKTHEYTPKKV
jgi:tetratricopeptide (TPR) repeat protein